MTNLTDKPKEIYSIRIATKDDENFIFATFLRGLYYGDSWFSQIPKSIFMNNYKHVIQELFKNKNTIIHVACLSDDPNVILGYSILRTDHPVVHWVYVKAAFRKHGIGRALLPKEPIAVTHLSSLGATLLPKLKSAIFNPFLIN